MKCAACNANITASMKFCGGCGTLLTEAAQPKPVKRHKWNRRYALFGLVALSLLATASAVLVLFALPNYIKTKGSVTVLEKGGETVVIPYGKRPVPVMGTLAGKAASMDGTKAALLINEYDLPVNGYVLYWVTDKPYRIAEGVHEMILSASGEGILFTRNADTAGADLFLYNDGRITNLSNHFNRTGGMCISPNGKAAAYTVVNDHTAFYYDGKQTHNLGHDIVPVAIANKGRYVYYHRSNTLYAQRGANNDTRTRLGELSDLQWGIHANRSVSQIIFTPDGRTFLSRKAGQRANLPGSIQSMVLPYGSAIHKNGQGFGS
jgi:WD40 repeat protein